MNHDLSSYKAAGCIWAIVFAPFFLLILSIAFGEDGIGIGVVVFFGICFVYGLGRLLLEVFAIQAIGEFIRKFFRGR